MRVKTELPPLREDEQLPVREHEPTIERIASWGVFLLPHAREEESLLVEWARGKGLTVLPQPPLLNNNYPQLLNKALKRLDETRKMENQNKVVTHGFPPIE